MWVVVLGVQVAGSCLIINFLLNQGPPLGVFLITRLPAIKGLLRGEDGGGEVYFLVGLSKVEYSSTAFFNNPAFLLLLLE